ncbi:unnamed protein product [Rhizophagus irregularis]|nr:unnamed protein product [Rhizophagus irregularis]
MNPYRKPTEQNFRNKNHSYSSSSVPRLNKSSAIYMQNVDNNSAPQSQFQPNEDLNESFTSNNYNNTFYD